MYAFLRKNLMIVVSIALPLLVVIFFALASFIPDLYTTPPAHDLLLSLHDRASPKNSEVRYNFTIKGGQLKAVVVRTDNPVYESNPRLFLYDHQSGEAREISFQLPEKSDEYVKGEEFSVPEFGDRKVSETLRAPDGYEFRGHRRGGGLMSELFGGRRNRTDVSIAKGSAVVRIHLPSSDYWYNSVRFVGWVLD